MKLKNKKNLYNVLFSLSWLCLLYCWWSALYGYLLINITMSMCQYLQAWILHLTSNTQIYTIVQCYFNVFKGQFTMKCVQHVFAYIQIIWGKCITLWVAVLQFETAYSWWWELHSSCGKFLQLITWWFNFLVRDSIMCY